MLELTVKIIIALAFGALIGYLMRVFSRKQLRFAVDVAAPKLVQVDSYKVNFVQGGHGPDLLLVHGIGASLFVWRLVFRKLMKHYRVTAIDLPGFGASEKNPELDYGLDAQTQRLARIIEVLQIGPAYVVGSSMGGLLGLWLLKTRPDLVKGLATISPAAHKGIVFVNTQRFLGLVKIIGKTFVTPYIMEKILRRVVSDHKLLTPSVINEYYRPYAEDRMAPVCFWRANDTLRDQRIPDEIGNLSQPVLVLHGLQDKVIRKHFIDDIFKHIGRGELVEHPTGGHHLMEDAPDFVTEKITRFFDSTKALT